MSPSNPTSPPLTRPTPAPRRVLVIEDARDISDLVQMHLRDEGYEVEAAYDGIDGLEKAIAQPFDVIVLDLMLPGMDGLAICRRLRARTPYVWILMLTSKGTELDRVLGLEMGADDYLTKPFSIRELLARVKALLRRPQTVPTDRNEGETPAAEEGDSVVQTGDLRIETAKRKVTMAGSVLALTAREFDLLLHFATHPGLVYTRTQLLDVVWGNGYEGYEHTVNSHINRLRAKLEADPAHPRYLLTAWGVGYKFSEDL